MDKRVNFIENPLRVGKKSKQAMVHDMITNVHKQYIKTP